YISPNTVVFEKNPALVYDRIDAFFAKAEESFAKLSGELKHAKPKELFVDSTLLKNQLEDFLCVQVGSSSGTQTGDEINFNTKPQPA
ncbi:hypothetical protein, partial [Winogradskyella poriferorum]